MKTALILTAVLMAVIGTGLVSIAKPSVHVANVDYVKSDELLADQREVERIAILAADAQAKCDYRWGPQSAAVLRDYSIFCAVGRSFKELKL